MSLGPLPASVLDRPVVGQGLTGSTLADQLDQRTTLLVFPRHYG